MRATSSVGAPERERRVRGVERRHAAVARAREPEPTMPGPGPQTAASQPSARRPWCSAPAVVIASPSPPKPRPAVRCPASRPRRAARRPCASARPAARRPRSARSRACAPGAPWANAHATGGELAVQREHRHRPLERQLQALVLDRRHGVLQARVVELHHVRLGRAWARQPAREVDVHDVKAARAEAEIERLHVDDQLVAELRAADQRHVGDRRALDCPAHRRARRAVSAPLPGASSAPATVARRSFSIESAT